MPAADTVATRVFLSVGSNILPEENVPKAVEQLKDSTRVRALSTFYRTEPIDRPDQDRFLNGIVWIETALPPRALKFDVLRTIEHALGRVREADRYAARPIDLDIVLYDDWVVQTEDLQIPDPDLWHRPFLAVPLLELAPDTVLPNTGEALQSVVAAMDITGMKAEEEFTQCLRARLAQ